LHIDVDVLAVGHAAYDLSFYSSVFPAENTKVEVQELVECGGGPAANAAYLLSSWGTPTAFAGLIGNDLYGTRILDEFRRVGTDVSLVDIREGYSTPLSAIVISGKNGSRTIINRKVPARFEIAVERLRSMNPKILLFDGHELAASLEALALFPDAISILDAGSPREGVMELARRVDYLAASKRFALATAGVADLDSDRERQTAMHNLRQQFGTNTIVTLGEGGLIADDGTGFLYLPAFPTEAVDTTGAGDIFHGAFAYAVLRQMNFVVALEFAAMAGALSVRKRGGRNSTPALAELEKALQHG
jgi:sugar/nucleoside kinase (ribokinase family)